MKRLAVLAVVVLGALASVTAAMAVNTDNTLTAENITAAAGVSTGTVEVATWTDSDSSCPLPSGDILTGTIDWGDGTPLDSSTTVACNSNNDGGTITGSHTYAAVGKYTITVTFDDLDPEGDEGAIQSTSTATVVAGVPHRIRDCLNGGWMTHVDNKGKLFKSQKACIEFVENNNNQGQNYNSQ